MQKYQLTAERTEEAIQEAIDHAAADGGGQVILNPGLYECGTIYLKSNVELHLCAGARIVGHPKPEMYDDFIDPDLDTIRPEFSRKAMVICAHAENVSITGSGEVNGQGPAFYDTNVPQGSFFQKPPLPRPRMFQFFQCRNVRIEGISCIDSPAWTFWFRECEDVYISKIRVAGCQQMINNDGIDVDSCRRVTISDCILTTGDDCLVLRAIRGRDSEPAICEKVIISNCILDSRCQGIRIGCPSDDTIRHSIFSNIVFSGRGSGIHFNYPVHYLRKNCNGYVQIYDLQFHHFLMDCGNYPVRINIDDGVKPRGVNGIIFSDFKVKAKFPFEFKGSAVCVLKDICLHNIEFETEGKFPVYAEYTEYLKLENFRFTMIRNPDECETVEIDRSNCRSWECF